jgi:hypothetical protein
MLGSWLFDAAFKPMADYEEGRATALGTLCRIFCNRQRRQPFLDTYSDRFYSVISRGLSGEPPSLSAIIMNSADLFTTELEGLRVLVPDFVAAARRILPRVCQHHVLGCLIRTQRGVFFSYSFLFPRIHPVNVPNNCAHSCVFR